jgi:hypothetical protein
MGIALYSKPMPNYRFSNQDTEYSPFTVTFNGIYGGSIVRRIYVRNDELDYYYTEIQVVAVDSASPSRVDGTKAGWEWKLMEKDVVPDELEWHNVTAGNTLSLSADLGTKTLGDTATYLSFFVYVKIPPDQLADNIKDIVLRLTATKSVVG